MITDPFHEVFSGEQFVLMSFLNIRLRGSHLDLI